MIRVEETVDLPADPATTFAFLSAVERYPEWLPGIVRAEQTSPGEVRPGTSFRLAIAGPGGVIEATGQVTEVDPGRRVALSGQSPQAKVGGEFALEPIPTGTRVRIAMRVELQGFYRFGEGMASAELKRQMPAVIDRLRQRLAEPPGGGPAPG